MNKPNIRQIKSWFPQSINSPQNNNQHNKNINKEREIIKRKQKNSGLKNTITELKNTKGLISLPKHGKERISKF